MFAFHFFDPVYVFVVVGLRRLAVYFPGHVHGILAQPARLLNALVRLFFLAAVLFAIAGPLGSTSFPAIYLHPCSLAIWLLWVTSDLSYGKTTCSFLIFFKNSHFSVSRVCSYAQLHFDPL